MEEKKKSGIVTAGLVLGIVGVCTSFMPIINNLSFVMGILAIIFALIGVKKAGKGKIITVIVLGILAIVVTINSQQAALDALNEINNELDMMSGNSTEEILQNYVDVKIGKFEIKEDEYFTETKLVVQVKNKSSETKSFEIQVEAIKGNGERIDQDYIHANDLNAGQSQSFEIFTYIDDEKISEMEEAEFKIVQVSMY